MGGGIGQDPATQVTHLGLQFFFQLRNTMALQANWPLGRISSVGEFVVVGVLGAGELHSGWVNWTFGIFAIACGQVQNEADDITRGNRCVIFTHVTF